MEVKDLPYIHFTDDQKLRAASVNLEEFLKMRGEKLIRSGREWPIGATPTRTR
jgi:hypothetical protein